MGDFLDEYWRTNQAGIDFLLTDLDLAMTFMAVAEASQNMETVRRSYSNARAAHDAVVRLLGRLTPDAEQRREIDTRLVRLRTRLEAVGY